MDTLNKDIMLFEEIFPQTGKDAACERHYRSDSDVLFDEIFNQPLNCSSVVNDAAHITRFPFEGFCDYAFPVVISDD
jgi:hypothetical protein